MVIERHEESMSCEMQSLPAVVSRRYRILGKVGEGCTTEVFRVLDMRLQRVVALKVLRKPYREQPAFTQAFEDEARAMARITHPNIVRVYDYDRAHGYSVIVMEYVHGRTLKAYLSGHALLAEKENRRLAGQLLDALSAVRGTGIAHPLLTPEEVLVTEAGTFKIVGIGKLGEAGGVDEVGRTSLKEAEEQRPGDRCVLEAIVGRYRAPEMVAPGGAGASDPTIAIPVVNASSPEADTVRFPIIRSTGESRATSASRLSVLCSLFLQASAWITNPCTRVSLRKACSLRAKSAPDRVTP